MRRVANCYIRLLYFLLLTSNLSGRLSDYPMVDGCEDLKCGFYATCQMFDRDDDDDDVSDDVINEVNTLGSERGNARCVCPAFCSQVRAGVCVVSVRTRNIRNLSYILETENN